jgi:diguanylate cyclase (GGDEF)-like protein
MSQTIFILGTNSDQCAELKNILQEKINNPIVTTAVGDPIPALKESDTVIITGEERNTGILYRHLLNKLEDQVRRAQLLSELIRLFSSPLQLEDILERAIAKSTEVLGDTAFIVLNEEAKLRLEAAYSTDRERLVRMLVTTLNISPQVVAGRLLQTVLEDGAPLVISNLQQASMVSDLQPFVDKYSLLSLIASPIRSKDQVLGAFISMTTAPRVLSEQDLTAAAEISDFMSIALENARLFSELQRTAITDSLTGVYNTRFFHKILSSEAARAHRYSTPLSLLMIDIDAFKLVNDTFGHLVGDKVLSQVGRVLESAVRNTDYIFRCGGDEFGVVLPGTTEEGAVRVAEKILQRVETGQILQSLGYTGTVTVSIGVSDYQKGSHFETLVAEADQALYASKKSSKNCVRTFSQTEFDSPAN